MVPPAPFTTRIKDGDLQERDLKKMAGNGMHAPWVGMLIGWVLANIVFEEQGEADVDDHEVQAEAPADKRLSSRSRSRSP